MTEMEEYKGKTIIAWHYYIERHRSPESYDYDDYYSDSENNTIGSINTRCYINPRLLKAKDGTFTEINPEDFPQYGSIEVKLRGQLTSEELFDQVGELVQIQINTLNSANYSSKNWYTLQFNPQFSRTKSEIWIEKFNDSSLYQIIDSSSNLEEIKQQKCFSYQGKIYTNKIMILINQMLWGPFDYDIKDEKLYLSSEKDNQYYIAPYNVDDFKQCIFDVRNENNLVAASFIGKNSIDNPANRTDRVDWIDDVKLLDYLSLVLKNQGNNTKEQIRNIKNNIEVILNQDQDVSLTPERKTRIVNLIDSVTDRNEFIKQIAVATLDNKELGLQLAKNVCKEHFDFIESNSKDIQIYKDTINLLQSDYTTLSKKVAILKRDESIITEEVKNKNNSELQELNQEIIRLKEETNTLLSTNQLAKDIQSLREERDKAQEEADKAQAEYDFRRSDLIRLEQTEDELDKKLKETIESFKGGTKIITNNLEKKLINRLLNEINEETEQPKISLVDTKLFALHHSGEDIIDSVSKYLNNTANRIVAYNDVVNYLICISQGFITTFAGSPGTGKTSLCTLLAKSLGLAGVDNNKRYIEISVERGWTSQKDYIGYYNPLTKRMEKSNYEVFDALKNLSEEHEELKAPLFILLDEANLSPIEHYWASFLNNCDIDSSFNRSINMGGNSIWKISNNLRFLATVNFDHTTEELSPRFLDRSWVILLEPMQIDDELLNTIIPDNADTMISYNDLVEAFEPNDSDTFDESMSNKWDNIKSIFKANQMTIMPRNLKMVANYCKVACKYMDRQSPETRYAPLDYAFSQKILPTINGSGDNYRNLIKQLREECGETSMPLSAKILERMDRHAQENMGYYQFFI